jgi:hypothetical protein
MQRFDFPTAEAKDLISTFLNHGCVFLRSFVDVAALDRAYDMILQAYASTAITSTLIICDSLGCRCTRTSCSASVISICRCRNARAFFWSNCHAEVQAGRCHDVVQLDAASNACDAGDGEDQGKCRVAILVRCIARRHLARALRLRSGAVSATGQGIVFQTGITCRAPSISVEKKSNLIVHCAKSGVARGGRNLSFVVPTW